MNGTPNNTNGRFVVSLDFTKKAKGDCIPDDRMAELVKRLIAVVPEGVENDIVRSEEPPQDRTKLWYQPSTKKLYEFNPSNSSWEETNVDNFSVCISPESSDALTKDEAGCLLFDPSELAGHTEFFEGSITSDGSGGAVKTVVLNEFEDVKASVTVLFLEDPGASARWWISDQEVSSVTVSFAGLANSTTYDLRITVTKTS